MLELKRPHLDHYTENIPWFSTALCISSASCLVHLLVATDMLLVVHGYIGKCFSTTPRMLPSSMLLSRGVCTMRLRDVYAVCGCSSSRSVVIQANHITGIANFMLLITSIDMPATHLKEDTDLRSTTLQPAVLSASMALPRSSSWIRTKSVFHVEIEKMGILPLASGASMDTNIPITASASAE